MRYRKLNSDYDILISEEPQSSRNPPVIRIGKRTYFRFMDCLYTPCRVSQLPVDLVRQLNDQRDALYESIADDEYNQEVYRVLTDAARAHKPTAGALLDFGCGAGEAGKVLRSQFPDAKIFGVDIRAAKTNKNYDKMLRIEPNEDLPFADDFFDLCFSFFVFHFPVYEKQVQEIARVMSEGSVLAFNMINSTDISIIERLDSAGFDVLDSMDIETRRNFGRGILFQKRGSGGGDA
jgi:predicted TPR repeat methyltransferase